MLTSSAKPLGSSLIVTVMGFVLVIMWSAHLVLVVELSSYNFRRVLQVTFFLLVLILCLSRFSTLKIFGYLPLSAKLMILIAFFVGSVSALQSQYPMKALQEVGLYCLLILSTWVVADSVNEKNLIRIVIVTSAAIGLYGFGYLFQYAIYLQYPPDSWMHTVYGFTNPRTLNHAQNWLIPLLALLPLLASEKTTLLKRLSWIPLAVMYFFLFLSESRGVALALLTSAVICYVFVQSSMKPLLRIHCKALVAGLLSYGLLIRLVPYFLGHGFSGFRPFSDVVKAYDRLELWAVAWHSTVQNPWLGIGPQHFITFMERGPGSPHNITLQWLSEWGVIATLCIVLTLSWGALSFLRGLRSRLNENMLSPQEQYIQISVLWACVSAMVHAQISGVLITPMSQLLMVLVVGYCLSVHNEERKKGESYVKAPNTFERVVNCLMSVMILFLSLAFFMIFYWEFIEGGYPISLDGESMAPRFWQNGAFHL